MTFSWIVAVIFCLQCACNVEPADINGKLKPYCAEGKIYFGNVNESYPELVQTNGIYKIQNYSYEGYHVYKHHSEEEYMFHVHGKVGASGRWMIGPAVGDRKRAMFSVRSDMYSPALHAWRYWRTRGPDRAWKILHNVKSVCSGDLYEKCTSGRLLFSGLEKEHPQAYALGEYTLTGQTLNYRPVYKQTGATSRPRFLYYTYGFWFVGSAPGRLGGSMMVADSAFQPERIVNVWEAFQVLEDKFTAVPKKHLRFTCLGLREADYPCESQPCENRATCQVGDNQVFCKCAPGYFGTKCEYNKSCGTPLEVTNGKLVSRTGTGLLDLAFYKCQSANATARVIAVCENGQEWHVKGTC